MNEQLEQPIEGGTGEVLPEATVSPAGEEAVEKTSEGTENPEGEVNNESPTDENAENADSDAGLSASEEEATEQKSGSEQVQDTGSVLQPRNYYAEWQELAEAHPEVVGKELPEDIYQACMQSELPPLRVYESMMLQKQAEQISALQQEIATLRQNAENSARAPVMAAAGGPDSEPEDLFLKGFNSYYLLITLPSWGGGTAERWVRCNQLIQISRRKTIWQVELI